MNDFPHFHTMGCGEVWKWGAGHMPDPPHHPFPPLGGWGVGEVWRAVF